MNLRLNVFGGDASPKLLQGDIEEACSTVGQAQDIFTIGRHRSIVLWTLEEHLLEEFLGDVSDV